MTYIETLWKEEYWQTSPLHATPRKASNVTLRIKFSHFLIINLTYCITSFETIFTSSIRSLGTSNSIHNYQNIARVNGTYFWMPRVIDIALIHVVTEKICSLQHLDIQMKLFLQIWSKNLLLLMISLNDWQIFPVLRSYVTGVCWSHRWHVSPETVLFSFPL